ncbi:hypothetical protein [Deinococcus aerophilus]|uniref:DUF2147 domain-containing protein n=1 Tax=Deinococcus aerophilus TaxID=522488 RepID=A0ABQ2GXP5_9DEIO|nr:hypothetical protein [Deinococcus aerophilus]GGM16958.1 hypothetical protein GCM10010841_26560 [Deinococcus aerophilus]
MPRAPMVTLILILACTAPLSLAAAPRSGVFKGELTGDFRGNTISFRVSADGKTISDVTMTGYWRCSDSLTNTTYKTNPRVIGALGAMPGTVAVKQGKFETTAKKPYLAWDFEGRFTSVDVAEGSFMAQSMDCTSYRLKFKAVRTVQ